MNAALAAGLRALACLGAAGSVLAAAAPPDVAALLAQDPGSGFAQVIGPRAFSFPADHGPHPEYRQEWWYTTGNLEAADGERFGFELTFFRYALAPPGTAAAGPSAWRTDTLYMAHFALTDVAQQRFRFAQKFSRAALGLAGATADPLHVWLDDWYLKVSPDVPSSWLLHAAGAGYELELELDEIGRAHV